ncbi:Regulator of chromosome condensation 1/beta-lactamase-inhibitor protein II [Tylopilus felleus]
MFRLEDIPVEVLLDNVLPALPVADLLRLGATDHFFASLCNDDTFWKRKLQQDFNFSTEGTARSTGWKFIYQGLSRPRTFVWGESSNGRLGRRQFPFSNIADVPFPVELRFDSGVSIVHIAAAGMCFFALDSKGSLYAWGTLNGVGYALQADGFSAPAKPAHTPMKLNLPTAMRTISCGRLHATGLDDKLNVWNFLSFGRPFRLVTPLLDGTTPDSIPVQVESGWSFSSVLNKGGDVYVWWPLHGEMKEQVDTRDAAMDEQGLRAHSTERGIIQCAHWDLPHNPYKLPELPRLPKLDGTIAEDIGVYLVKIAALHSHLIGLTNHGHVVKILVQTSDTARLEGWIYLPQFSESEKIKQHVTSAASDLSSLQDIHITHISAQFETFVAYSTGSSSVVLMGSHETDPNTEPRVLPALQNKDVISVVLGDYHFGALTSTGKLLTWGGYSRGALGLGDPTTIEPGQPGGYRTEHQRQHALQWRGVFPPDVTEPAEVGFDHEEKRKRFCFAATSAGWHMGALVIDLEPDDPNEEQDGVPMPGGFPAEPGPSTNINPPGSWGIPRPAIFRVGFAGRGATRGWHQGNSGS